MSTPGKKYCFNCGAEIDEKAEICPKCGVRQPTEQTVTFRRFSEPNKMAITALVLGILSIFNIFYAMMLLPIAGFILPVLSIIFGLRGISKARKIKSGNGKAIAGLVLGMVFLSLLTVFLIVGDFRTLPKITSTPPPPSTPSLSLTSESTDSVSLEGPWRPLYIVSEWEVYDATSGTFTKCATFSGDTDVSAFTVKKLSPSTKYRFSLVAVNESGRATSNIVAVRTHSVVQKTVSVGRNPDAVGVNPKTDTIYVANVDSNTVSVIDGKTDSVIKTISVGGGPVAIEVNSTTNMVYVADIRDDMVSVIDGKTNSVVKTISSGGIPYSIGVDPTTNTIYVANWETVSIINGKTDSIIKSISVGNGNAVGVNPKTDTVYVANDKDDTVSIIDGKTDSVIKTISVGVGNGNVLGVNPKTDTIYVANGDISIINGNTNSIVKTISVGSNSDSIGVDPITDTVYVANEYSDTVNVIDGKTDSIVKTFIVGNNPDAVEVNPTTHLVYVTNSGSNTVSVINGNS